MKITAIRLGMLRLPSLLAVHRIGGAGTIPAWRVSLLVCLVAALTACSPQSTLRTGATAWSDAGQLVLVITRDWNDSHGTLRAFARGSQGWQPAGATFPVVIGRTGAAWGLGLHPTQPGPGKREGDGRSPAGVFAIGTAFGYAQTASTGMPYAALNANEYCIDVSGSPLYNRIVDAAEVGAAAVAGSSEPMRRDLHVDGDQAYKFGFVIEHNPNGVEGAGSCIFAHLWKSADSSTAGCTAMAEGPMRELLSWLRADKHPLFVLLPQAEYLRLRAAWQLPGIGAP
jgi:L,D-peptidoglycan transpeptidase YkuD (ErfK/YbiS/YcfS/YnhG family)